MAPQAATSVCACDCAAGAVDPRSSRTCAGLSKGKNAQFSASLHDDVDLWRGDFGARQGVATKTTLRSRFSRSNDAAPIMPADYLTGMIGVAMRHRAEISRHRPRLPYGAIAEYGRFVMK